MKRAFKNKSWWNNMSANFVGAFLGIVVTFGTTAVIDRHSRKEMARRSELIAIAHLDNDIMELEEKFADMRTLDSLYTFVSDRYPDRLGEIDTDTLVRLCISMTSPHFFLGNPSAESAFSNSMETWRNFSDLNLLYSINSCFSLKNTILDFYHTVMEYHAAAFDRAFETQAFDSYSDPVEIVRTYLGNPATRNFLQIHHMYSLLLPELTGLLKEENNANKAQTGITDDELHALFPNIYTDTTER